MHTLHRTVLIYLCASIVIEVANGQFPAIAPVTAPTVAVATNGTTEQETISCENAQDAFESCLTLNPTCDKCLAPTFTQSHTCNSLQDVLCVILTSTACGLGCQETCILVIQDYYNCLCISTRAFQCAGIPETAPAIAPPPTSPVPMPVPIPAPIPPPVLIPSVSPVISTVVDFADRENTDCTDTRIAFESCLMEHQQCYNCISSTFTGEKSCNAVLDQTCVTLTGTACGLVCRQYCRWAIENYYNCHCDQELPFGCPYLSSSTGSNPSPTGSSVPAFAPPTGMNGNGAESTTTPSNTANRENDISRATGPGTTITTTSESKSRRSAWGSVAMVVMSLYEIGRLLL